MKPKTFPTLEVLATAVATYEHNNRSIIRNPVTVDQVSYLSNRQLISGAVLGKGAPFVVNDFHRTQAEGIVTYLQQCVIMQSLKGRPDRFLAQITDILSNQTVDTKEFGIVSWAPHLADQYQKKDHVREISARYEYCSRYIGKVGDKIEIDFTMIDKRYIQSMDCFAVYGYSQDNLVFYWAKTLDKVCEVGRISGRIKAHKEDEHRNDACVTHLNYVKVL